MRRFALALAAALVLAGGCAPAPRPPEEVVFWLSEPPAAIEPIVRRFEAENPALRVRVLPIAREAMADSIASALAGGDVPDLCELDGATIRPLLASGALSDWSAGVADQRDSLVGWDACRVGDALYGMPWRVSPRVLFWNAALFARAGLDTSRAPATWDDLGTAVARIQRLGRGVHGYGMAKGDSLAVLPEFLSLAWGNGGTVLTAGGDSSTFDSPRNVEALAFLLRLRHAGTRDSVPALDEQFAAGRIGARIADARLAARLRRDAPGLRFRVAPVPARSADAGPATPWGDAVVLASFTHSRHKEHALRLARFLVRPANAVESYAAGGGALPANAGADTLEWFRARPAAARLEAEAGRARFGRAHPAWPAMAGAIGVEVEMALDGTTSAEQAVEDAGARVAVLAGRR